MYIAMIMAMHTFTRFMLVCIWKRMRQMDDNLIVRIATIQAIVMSIFFTVITWIQLHGQPFGNQVIFYFISDRQVCLGQPSKGQTGQKS